MNVTGLFPRTILAVMMTAYLGVGVARADDREQTVTEGVAAGSVLGGIVGALLGGKEDRGKNAAIGALLGGILGGAHGNNVAQKKAEYAQNEALFTDAIARYDGELHYFQDFNQRLEVEIAEIAQQHARIAALSEQSDQDKNQLVALEKRILKQIERTQKAISRVEVNILAVDKDIKAVNSKIDQLKSASAYTYVAQAGERMDQLQAERSSLQVHLNTLKNISPKRVY